MYIRGSNVKRLSLIKMIIALFIFTGLIPMLGVGIFTLNTAESELHKKVVLHNELYLSTVHDRLGEYFGAQKQEIEFISHLDSLLLFVEKFNNGETDYVLKSYIDELLRDKVKTSQFSLGYVTDENGVVIAASEAYFIGASLSDRNYIKKSFDGEINYSDLFYSDVSNTVVMPLSAPVYSSTSNQIEGTINFLFEVENINAIVHNGINLLGETGDSYLVNSEGILYSNTVLDPALEPLVDKIDTETVNALDELIKENVLNEIVTNIVVDYRNERVISSGMPVLFGDSIAGLVVEIDEVEALASIRSFRNIIYILLAVVSIVGIALSATIIINILKPINKISEISLKVSKGNNNVDLEELLKRDDELGKLAKAFSEVVLSNKAKAEMISSIARGKIDNLEIPKDTIDDVYISINQMIENFNIYAKGMLELSDKLTYGQLDERVNSENLPGIFGELAENTNNIINVLTNIIDILPIPIYSIDDQLKINFINKSGAIMGGTDKESAKASKCYELFETDMYNTDSCTVKKAFETSQQSSSLVNLKTNGTKRRCDLTSTPLFSDNEVVGTIEHFIDQTDVLNTQDRLKKQAEYQKLEVEQLVENIEKLSKGNFSLDFKDFDYDEDTEDVHNVFDNINQNLSESVKSISSYIGEISEVLSSLSNNDLDLEVNREYVGEFDNIKVALNKIIGSFNEVIKNIYNVSSNVSQSSVQMSMGAQSVSSGVTEQAASIEEISATITEVSAQVNENANMVKKVKDIAGTVEEKSRISDGQMTELNEAMNEISNASRDIQKVLKLIEDIAFQTNILSLNAAVEAARAGQHGKGFAVIAEDVRALALKSASAADETNNLVDAIISRINTGRSIADVTTESLKEILESAKLTTELSQKVANATNEQATAISQIDLSVNQISEVVQSTSINTHESAETSKQLSEKASELLKISSEFKIKDLEIEEIKFSPRQDLSSNKKENSEIVIDLFDNFDF